MTNQGTDVDRIDIRPGVNILGVLKNLNYKPWYALAEFVDNALQSFLDMRSDLPQGSSVSVWLDVNKNGSGTIRIRDDAFGIAPQDFPRAFKAADVPPDNTGLSEFGMGMKSAATWFAQIWTVRTSVVGDAVQRTVEFDLSIISAERLETLPVVAAPAAPASHFTTIEMRELNHMPRGRTVDKIKKHLSSIYRNFLRSGTLHLYYNDEPLLFDEVAILEAPSVGDVSTHAVVWRKDIVVELVDGRKASGFVALRAVGSTSEAGLSLFRRDRLIMGSHDETYRPAELFGSSNTYVYQRLFGELALTGFDVSYTKDGVQWDDGEEEFVEKLIESVRSAPLDLIRQARQMRVKEVNADQTEALERTPREVAENFAARLNEVEVESEDAAQLPPEVPDELEGSSTLSPEPKEYIHKVTVETDRGAWEIVLVASTDESLEDWIELGAELVVTNGTREHTTLNIRVNMSHPFTRRFMGATGESADAILSMACAIAISATLAKRAGIKSGQFLHYLNRTLRAAYEIGVPDAQ